MSRWKKARTSREVPPARLLLTMLLASALGRLTRAADELQDGEAATIGVVSAWPVRAQQLAAAVDAARGAAGAAGAPVAPVEPGETLAVPAHVCLQASAGSAAVVAGSEADGETEGEGGDEGGGAAGTGGAADTGGAAAAVALGAAAAARAGVPLILVDEAGAGAPAAWATLAMHPHPDVLAQACVALCSAKGWTRAVLLHAGGPRGAAQLAPDSEELALAARRLPTARDPVLLRNLLLVLKKSGATNFIVWCSAECTERVLDMAQRVGLLADRHSYILLSLDLHTRELADYSYGGANITGLRLFDPESEAVKEALTAWRLAYVGRLSAAEDAAAASAGRRAAARVARAPPTALLLAYDAASFVVETLRRLGLPGGATPGTCETGQGALYAETLLNYIRSEQWVGASGVCKWEADGSRRRVRLQVVELARGGRLAAVGAWAPADGLAWRRAPHAVHPPLRGQMTNRTFTVLIAKNSPYVMRQESTERLAGNERYEGFCIELIEQLAELLHFNYTFIEQLDKDYGKFDAKTKKWSGMMGRLIEDPNIDFAITDLTITAEREQDVDFTTPFMNLGISILFRTPKAPEPALFAFLHPFSNGVWLCLGLAYVGTSLLLYVVGRLCPEEWQNPYPCIEEPEALENQFTLANALWFNLGAVLLQGSEIAPIAYGTRAVASVWWLFALVITSSYTANLATLLAKKTSTELIHGVQELAENDLGITYGAKAGGSTYTFFENSQSEMYQNMFQNMKDQEMPSNNDIGVEKVMKENYAFLMESTTIEYMIERNCEVTMVGGLLDSKGYGIAMKKNSPYRQALNLALLNLQEGGVLREMKHKWWKEMHGGGACKVLEERENEELSMRNFLGLFLVLVVGCALGIVISCMDMALVAAKHPRDDDRGFIRNFWAELRFVFLFEHLEKPVHGSLLPSPTPPGTDEGTGTARGSAHSSGERDADADADAELEEGAARERTGSQPHIHSRRRSSIHAASMRLARHARRERDSATPGPATARSSVRHS